MVGNYRGGKSSLGKLLGGKMSSGNSSGGKVSSEKLSFRKLRVENCRLGTVEWDSVVIPPTKATLVDRMTLDSALE